MLVLEMYMWWAGWLVGSGQLGWKHLPDRRCGLLGGLHYAVECVREH